MNGVAGWLLEKIGVKNLNTVIINSILAAFLLIVGIAIGLVVNFILRKIIDKINIRRHLRSSFIELFLTAIKWCIYIIFLNLALQQLNIPEITAWISSVIIVFPALVGSLLLVGMGFAIAVYLSELISESKIVKAEILSTIIFYFVNYVFVVFSVKTALISLDKNTVNIIIISLTIIISTAVAYWQVKKQPKKHGQ